jgi:opacity protein-like surface antigen
MRTLKLTTLALALAGALPTQAAEPTIDVNKELKALKDKVAELEAKSQAAPVAAGMTPEQKQDFDRIAVKAEALEDGRDASGLKNLKISGYMDATYIYGVNRERGTFQFLVPISKEPYSYDNGYFGTLALDIQKETDSNTKFHLTLYPMRGGGDVMGEKSIVHEASVWIPLGSLSTKLFAGQLPDWSGYEYYAPNQYKGITHNMLFDFTLPASYTGMGLELVRGKWDVKLMLANMNASVRNVGESVPMFVFRGDYAGGEYWGLGVAGAAGYKTNFRAAPIQPTFATPNPPPNPHLDGKDSLYTTAEVDGWYLRGDLTLNAHLSYGSQQKAAVSADPNTGSLRASEWIGASALVAYKLTIFTEGMLRVDYIHNSKNGGGLLDYTIPDAVNGIGPELDATGTPVNPDKGTDRYAVTAGLGHALNSSVLLKLEYRYDGATKNVFGNKDALLSGANPKYGKSNSLVGASVVFFF